MALWALEAIGEMSVVMAAYQELAKTFAGMPAAQESRRRMEALKKLPRK